MSISLTLGTKHLLSNYQQPYILIKPLQTDESTLRVELTGTNYKELLNNHFNWHFTYYKFIYLKFNQDQASLFENKFVNQSYFESNSPVLILADQLQNNQYIIIRGANEQIEPDQLESDLNSLTTAELGMFSKSYTIR